MPCNCEHMEPHEAEQESQLLCKLTLYVKEECIGVRCPHWVHEGAKSIYGTNRATNDALTADICSLIREMSKGEKSKWMYDGRNPKARMLADWWDIHQKWDKKREAKEKADASTEEFKRAALAKLTTEEMRALGIKG